MNARNDRTTEVEFIAFERMNGTALRDACATSLLRSPSGDIDSVSNIADTPVNVLAEEFLELLKGGFCSICEICTTVLGRVGALGWGCRDPPEVVLQPLGAVGITCDDLFGLFRDRILELVRKNDLEAAIVESAVVPCEMENGGEIGPLIGSWLQT
jgi:hypothetical protein